MGEQQSAGAAMAFGAVADDTAPESKPLPPAPAQPLRPLHPGGVRRIGLVYLSLLALIVGMVAGYGAVGFRDGIGLIHNLLFLGRLQVPYDARMFTPASPWGVLVILVPVLGALIVTFLVSKFAPEARGHGVPEVMDAIYYSRGVIRPIVAVVKSIASAIAIGSGAAVGREGPIIQIGSGLGSTLGQLVRMQPGERITLVAAGAGAGIAATFNTPIGGVLFAIELMMPEVSAQTFLPVAIATGTATFIGRFYFGVQPAFSVPPLAPISISVGSAITLCIYASLGALVGLAAAAFVRGLYFMENLFERIPGQYLRHVFGMFLVGVLMYMLFRQFGHFYVEGVGYSTIQAILHDQLLGVGFLALLYAGKLFATTASLGSGSSGGIFSPSLFMGATIGAAYAGLLSTLHLPLQINVPSFAMVGMGAMVGGATGASMTAVAMIFEMTRDYGIVLPMILAVAVSVGVRRLLSRETIYTLKLFRRGHTIPKALQANMFLVRLAKDVMDKDVAFAPSGMSFETFLFQPAHRGRIRHVVVTEGSSIVGVLRVNTALRQAALRQAVEGGRGGVTMGELASPHFILVYQDEIVFDVIGEIWRREALMALVMSARGSRRVEDVIGVVTKEQVADSVAASISVYPDRG